MKEMFLGTGANGGIPQIDCPCENCISAQENINLRRLRSSVLVETSKGKIILDCGPDFRQQLVNINLKLADISLIAITHLHWDHAAGIMELSGGKPQNIPLLVSPDNQVILRQRLDIQYWEENKFFRFINLEEAECLGVSLVDIPHSHPKLFPTSAIVVRDGHRQIWYSPDVAEVTPSMKMLIKQTDLVIFDATFLNENVYPASKHGHTTIEKSAPQLYMLDVDVLFSHINHSENPEQIAGYLSDFGFRLTYDGMIIQS